MWTVFGFDKLAHVNKTIRKAPFNFPVTCHFVSEFQLEVNLGSVTVCIPKMKAKINIIRTTIGYSHDHLYKKKRASELRIA